MHKYTKKYKTIKESIKKKMPSPLKDLAYILSVGNDRFGFN